MSGQPLQTPLDAGKFREAYMANLNLRIGLDDVNLQANKVYKRTGQLPVEISDFRTTEEKLADVERLKIQVRSELGQIADGQNANKIAQRLTPAELTFYFQQSQEVNSIIRQRYSAGVLADIFIPFLQKYMSDTYANKGVATGLQQSSGANLLLSGENIIRDLAGREEYIVLADALAKGGVDIRRETGQIIDVLPPKDLYDKIQSIPNANDRFLILEESNNYIKDLPSKRDILRRINNVERLLQLKDIPSLRAEADRISRLITPTPDTYEQLSNIKRIIRNVIPTSAPPPIPPRIPVAEELGYSRMNDEGLPNYQPPSIPPSSAQMVIAEPAPDEDAPTARSVLLGLGSITDLLRSENLQENKALLTELNTFFASKREFGLQRGKTPSIYKSSNTFSSVVNGSLPAQRRFIQKHSTKLDEILKEYQFDKGKSGKGISGCGIAVKERRYSSKSDVDWGSGVSATERFVPFGRFVINRYRLNDDVIAVKRPAGSCIKEFPSTRVSRNLGKVIRKITGNGVPDFDDLEILDDGEKAYLHKLTKESRLLDRLSIPAPKKSEIDKDLNEFEIMKGEIMSGNDNIEMVKKFKMMLLKLSNKNALPKTQVREILYDLTSMGF